MQNVSVIVIYLKHVHDFAEYARHIYGFVELLISFGLSRISVSVNNYGHRWLSESDFL